jgi:DNA polymerase-3 subunit alpha
MPDIDIDFLDSRREEVIAYCIQKYGLKRASGIITFGTLAAKQAVRDVFRVLDIESDTVSKMIDSKLTLIENIKNNQKLKSYLEEHKKQKEGYLVAMKLEGLKRHTSIHAAGMVISSVDLDEVVPLYYHDNMYLTAYSMNYLEDLGLLKMDFLGLKNLNIIDRVLKDLRNDHIDLSFDTIPLNDKEALHVFYDVNTIGIFQFESEGMMNFLRKFKPRTFEDIYACLALYRPGPMGNIDIYIRRKEGKEKVNYYHPSLEPILKPTYGILIYQEQIMQVANVMASYSLGEADILRRAMSKKKEEVLLKEKDKFMSRAIQNGYEEKIALEVYELILKFASYGFNKAHSVAYAMISYKMAYLKAHYPAYFIRGLLDMSIGSSASTKDYIYEAKKNHLEILGPDINLSDKHYTIYNNQIRYPLYNIKNVGIQASELILEERKKGPFKDIYDFVKRTYSKTMNTGTLTSLILAGCFDSFHINRKTLITNLDLILNYAEVITYLDEEYALKPVLEEVEEYDKKTIMNQELEVFGFYLSTHPVLELREKYQKKISTKDLKNYFDKNIEMIVSIKRLKEIETKKQEKMGFLTCEDEADVLDVVLFPKIYQSLHCKQDDMILLKGHVEKRFDKLQVVASSIQKLEE